MAIHVITSDANGLLGKIKEAIKDGKIETWECDADGDFTHKTHDQQWYKKAWLRPKPLSGELTLNILAPKNTKLSTTVYAVYHGRFTEMLLSHFDKDFAKATSSSMPEDGDTVQGSA